MMNHFRWLLICVIILGQWHQTHSVYGHALSIHESGGLEYYYIYLVCFAASIFTGVVLMMIGVYGLCYSKKSMIFIWQLISFIGFLAGGILLISGGAALIAYPLLYQ